MTRLAVSNLNAYLQSKKQGTILKLDYATLKRQTYIMEVRFRCLLIRKTRRALVPIYLSFFAPSAIVLRKWRKGASWAEPCHSQVEDAFLKLARKMPALFSHDDLGKLSVEVAGYVVDRQVKDVAAQYKSEDRIDVGYWVKIFSIKDFTGVRFPMLKKLVSAVLTIFSGPLIESTFNIMDDIIEKDRTKLTISTYEAVAIVKTYLRKKNLRSTDLVIQIR